jgi:hypothetical protein
LNQVLVKMKKVSPKQRSSSTSSNHTLSVRRLLY